MAWSSDLRIYGYLPSQEYVTQSASRLVILVMVFLCYHLWFQIDFACPCNSNRNLIHCYSYMLLPSLIITSLIMWNDKRMGRIFRFACYHSSLRKGRCTYRGKFCLEFFIYLLQAATSAFLWWGSVLVDGDWYVCCGPGHFEEFKDLACMKVGELGPVEKATKVNMKNQSMVLGLTFFLLTALCSLVLAFPWGKWCTRRNYFRASFEEAILEQTELILWKEMDKAAAESVTKSLNSLSTSENNTTTSATPATSKSAPEESDKTEDKEKKGLNINVNWEEIACIADALIESMPNSFANNNIINVSINNNISGSNT